MGLLLRMECVSKYLSNFTIPSRIENVFHVKPIKEKRLTNPETEFALCAIKSDLFVRKKCVRKFRFKSKVITLILVHAISEKKI